VKKKKKQKPRNQREFPVIPAPPIGTFTIVVTGDIPTIRAVEDAIGLKATHWPHRCHEIACKMLRARLVVGVERYGHYHGPVSQDHPSYGRPFQRHGWIEAPDASIIDPTRWVFEGVKPYIYHTPPSDEYDPGGQQLIEDMLLVYPAGPRNPAADSPNLTDAQRLARAQVVQLEVQGPAQAHLVTLTGGQKGDFNSNQVFWLANLPLSSLGEHAQAIYEAIVDAAPHYKGFIPIDNWRLAMDRPIAENRPLSGHRRHR
jgi:hypothetical protein